MNELTGLEKLNKTRQELVKCYIECLEKEELPWRKGWDFHTQFNPITHIKYTGVNQLLLNMMSSLRGYNDPRWMTYLQIQKKGYKLVEAKGKGLPIEVWKIYDKEQKKNVTYIELINIVKKEELSNEDVAKRFQWKMRTFTVFNAKHIEGIEPYQEIKNEFNVHENRKKLIDNYAENTDLTIIESERSNGKCFYRPAQDIIMIPPKEYFHNEYSYLATLLHECCHSTLHEKRLNRLEGRNNFFGDEKYAIEELRAEISNVIKLR